VALTHYIEESNHWLAVFVQNIQKYKIILNTTQITETGAWRGWLSVVLWANFLLLLVCYRVYKGSVVLCVRRDWDVFHCVLKHEVTGWSGWKKKMAERASAWWMCYVQEEFMYWTLDESKRGLDALLIVLCRSSETCTALEKMRFFDTGRCSSSV